jgi:hypothetical protein
LNMQNQLEMEILPQPDDFSCGPTCLHSVYNFYDDYIDLHEIMEGVPSLEEGGTLAVLLANHALKRGYSATIYTYNLIVFDPTWFNLRRKEIRKKLEAQLLEKPDEKLRFATSAYIEFLQLGGRLRLKDLTAGLIRKYLKKSIPILTGLNATYLYNCAREYGPHLDYDDIRGYPTGHFVVLSGYNQTDRTVTVADPLQHNPAFKSQYYDVNINRLISAILLGVITYDANLLILEKDMIS